MALITVDISVSVDGYIAGPGTRQRPGLGEGGEALHAWLHHDEGRRRIQAIFAASGAVVTSHDVYQATGGWGEDGLYRMPVFVVTHHHQEPVVKGDTTFTFVTSGVDAALKQAAEAAGDQRVHVMGGASICQQALHAGLVDELHLHVAPVLLGGGIRLFDHLSEARPLDLVDTVQTPDATHLTYRIVR
jgi:dihydrofolate reductase